MNKNRLPHRMAGYLLAAAFALAGTAWAGQGAGQRVPDEFFIITEINMPKQQLILKRPTEVTVPMTVNNKTVISDPSGKHLQFKDLRAGDTVFISYDRAAQGDVAATIRMGAMTVEELQRRYLNGSPAAIPSSPAAPSHATKSMRRGKAARQSGS